MIAPGHAASGTVSIVKSTRLSLKIGSKNQPKRNAWVFDRASQLLMVPSKLKINRKTGILPTYFKRTR